MATGWHVEPEGLCFAVRCVPLPRGREHTLLSAFWLDFAAFWRYLERSVTHTDDVWVFGEGADQSQAELANLLAPNLCLPDLSGTEFALSDFLGRKVFLAIWASW